MIVETVRLSQKAKDQLLRLKAATGLKQWNELSRWALCVSLADPSPPSRVAVPSDSSVEMRWETFGGEAAEIFAALVRERCATSGIKADSKIVAEQFRLHLHRGIGMLAGIHLSSIKSMACLAVANDDLRPANDNQRPRKDGGP